MNKLRLLAILLVFGVFAVCSVSADPQKKSFGSGTKPPTISKDAPKPPVKTFGSGDKSHEDHTTKKTFGSGDKSVHSKDVGTSPKTGPPSDVGSKPKNSGFDSKAANDQRKAESKAAFTKGTAPATSYTDHKGKTIQIDPRDAKIAHLRGQLSEEKWHNRDLRERTFYSTYYSRPVIVYHDPYSSFFWYWMLDRSIEQQALWAYNHRYSMDQARYNDLMGRNAELAARVRTLESEGVARNTAYQPNGMADSDLMYQEDYVKAVYNPQPTTESTTETWTVLKVLLFIFLGLAIIALVVWLIFVKKW